MTREKIRSGVVVEYFIALKYLHSRKVVCNKYTNATAQQKLENLLVAQKETKKINYYDQELVVFHHEDFNEDLHCVTR